MSSISSVSGSAAFAVQSTHSQPTPPPSPPPADSDGDHDNSTSAVSSGNATSKVNVLA
jgi:hypothetical protein